MTTTVSSVSGGGLTWHHRGNAAYRNAGAIYTYYAIAPNPLSAAEITAEISVDSYFVLTAFGVSGVNTANPFDPGLPTIPAATLGTGSTASASFNAQTENDFLIGAILLNGVPAGSITGAGFTGISQRSSGSITGATEYQNGEDSGIHTVSFSLGGSYPWVLIGDALVPAIPAGSDTLMKVSAFTTTSDGTVQNTLVNNQDVNITTQRGGQVARTFSTAPATIPASGYIKVVLTAPASSTIVVSWGTGKPTNIQICTAYSAQV